MEAIVREIHKKYVEVGKKTLILNKERHELTMSFQKIEQHNLPLIPLFKIVELLEKSPDSSTQSTSTSLDEAKKELAELQKKLEIEYVELAEKIKMLIPKMEGKSTIEQRKDSIINELIELQKQIKQTKAITEKGKEDLKKIDEDCSKLLQFTQNIDLDNLTEYAQQYLAKVNK